MLVKKTNWLMILLVYVHEPLLFVFIRDLFLLCTFVMTKKPLPWNYHNQNIIVSKIKLPVYCTKWIMNNTKLTIFAQYQKRYFTTFSLTWLFGHYVLDFLHCCYKQRTLYKTHNWSSLPSQCLCTLWPRDQYWGLCLCNPGPKIKKSIWQNIVILKSTV